MVYKGRYIQYSCVTYCLIQPSFQDIICFDRRCYISSAVFEGIWKGERYVRLNTRFGELAYSPNRY